MEFIKARLTDGTIGHFNCEHMTKEEMDSYVGEYVALIDSTPKGDDVVIFTGTLAEFIEG